MKKLRESGIINMYGSSPYLYMGKERLAHEHKYNDTNEAFDELKSNVTWPEWEEVQRLTIVVAVFSVLFALATWGVDEIFAKTLEGFFNWIKA